MLKGFTTPLSPTGKSSLLQPPPWHNAGVIIAIEYWADPAVVSGLLPPGFAPAEDAGYCIGHFAEWQSTTDGREELLDPVRAQYHEFFVLIAAERDGKTVFCCPFMYVDTDINLYRGMIQGLPKMHASVSMTHSYPIDNPAGASLRTGSVLGASMCFRDRRVIDARLTLSEPGEEPLGMPQCEIFGVRHYPDLEHPDGPPMVYDVVRFKGADRQVANIWYGEAQLDYFPSPVHELHDLAPLRLGRACRYDIGFTIVGVEKVADLRE